MLKKKDNERMPYEPKNFEQVVGMQGFSDQLLKDHFTLYQGYVSNFNKLDQTLVAIEKAGNFGTPEFAELNRRLGWEFNGMRLHEFYFGNLTKTFRALDAGASLSAAIVKEFGSYELWEKDFRSMGTMRGIGWVVLYHDATAGRLFNIWVNEHDVGHMAGAAPLLVMDVFEHAYIRDYGIVRKDYIEKFMASIDWAAVESRYSQTA